MIASDKSKAFDRVRHAGFLQKLKFYGISGQVFDLVLSFFSNAFNTRLSNAFVLYLIAKH